MVSDPAARPVRRVGAGSQGAGVRREAKKGRNVVDRRPRLREPDDSRIRVATGRLEILKKENSSWGWVSVSPDFACYFQTFGPSFIIKQNDIDLVAW